VIGDTTIDYFFGVTAAVADPLCDVATHEEKLMLPFGEKVPAESFDTVVAGNAANAAVGASRLGLESSIWTLMGDDHVGQQALQQFKTEGVDTRHLLLDPKTRSNASAVLRVEGERTIIVFHERRTYELPSDLPEVDWLYITSMAPGWEQVFPKLMAYLVAHPQTKLVMQPGTYQLKSGHVVATELLHRAELFICNREEAADYLNHDRTTPIRTLLVGLHALGPKLVVITDGIAGSYGSNGQEHWFLGTRDDIDRVEATGAGDGYATALMVALAHGEPLPEAMRWGNLNAESIIGFVGAQKGILTLAQLKERLADPKCLKPVPYEG